ncbi:hypothetical protein OHA72_48125 [Dactylosporangium sp. NBC_01737]|uniref:hypothetical protein n=1 Tax=Dactylosporangium sp. NBC_01737 TaxID=2975959 RepID=UPI002E15D3E7|nr:hypothetical protein OHA72_48125 [Dactylosporangium sp. NBC_01737]
MGGGYRPGGTEDGLVTHHRDPVVVVGLGRVADLVHVPLERPVVPAAGQQRLRRVTGFAKIATEPAETARMTDLVRCTHGLESRLFMLIDRVAARGRRQAATCRAPRGRTGLCTAGTLIATAR